MWSIDLLLGGNWVCYQRCRSLVAHVAAFYTLSPSPHISLQSLSRLYIYPFPLHSCLIFVISPLPLFISVFLSAFFSPLLSSFTNYFPPFYSPLSSNVKTLLTWLLIRNCTRQCASKRFIFLLDVWLKRWGKYQYVIDWFSVCLANWLTERKETAFRRVVLSYRLPVRVFYVSTATSFCSLL